MARQEVVFVTVIPNNFAFAASSLADAAPRRLLDRVRKQLTRHGITGMVVGALDGTYEADRGEYQAHIHVLAYESDR
jgi:hypothetical protein